MMYRLPPPGLPPAATVGVSGVSATSASSGYQNLYVSALPPSVKDTDLLELFEPYGTIKSAKVMLDTQTGVSRGYGFVLFEREQQGCLAYAKLNGTQVTSAGVTFTIHVAASQHGGHAAAVESSLIYVRNIPATCSDDEVSNWFSACGTVTGFSMKPDKDMPNDYRLATVEFKTVASAKEAIAKTHNTKCFPQCTDRPVLAKFADSTELKVNKRLKREQQRSVAGLSVTSIGIAPSVTVGGAVVSPGGPIPAAAAQAPPPPPPPPFSASYDDMMNQSNNLMTNPTAGSVPALPRVNSSGAFASSPNLIAVSPVPGGTVSAPPPSGGPNLSQQPGNQNHPFLGFTPLPIEPRGGYQQVYFQGVLGLTPDGQLYPVLTEQCFYLNQTTSSQPATSHHGLGATPPNQQQSNQHQAGNVRNHQAQGSPHGRPPLIPILQQIQTAASAPATTATTSNQNNNNSFIQSSGAVMSQTMPVMYPGPAGYPMGLMIGGATPPVAFIPTGNQPQFVAVSAEGAHSLPHIISLQHHGYPQFVPVLQQIQPSQPQKAQQQQPTQEEVDT